MRHVRLADHEIEAGSVARAATASTCRAILRQRPAQPDPMSSAMIDLDDTEIVCRDISAEALVMNGTVDRLALVLDATNTSVNEWNPVTDEHRRSVRWFAALGYDTDDPSAADPFLLIHPDDQLGIDRLRRQLLAGHTDVVEHVSRYRHKDGTWRWHQLRGNVIAWDRHGRPIRLIVATTDVTELHRLYEQLTHSSTLGALASFSCGIAHDSTTPWPSCRDTPKRSCAVISTRPSRHADSASSCIRCRERRRW